MASFGEMAKGLTDVPIALLSALFGFLLVKKKSSQIGWIVLFFLIAIGGLMGTTVHTFDFSRPADSIIWTVLYVILFEIARVFALEMVRISTKEKRKEKLIVWVLEAILYVATLVVLYSPRYTLWAIDVMLVFGALELLRVAVCLVSYRHLPGFLKALMLLLLGAIGLQFVSPLMPNGLAVAIEHTLIAIGLWIAYRMVKPVKDPLTQNIG